MSIKNLLSLKKYYNVDTSFIVNSAKIVQQFSFLMTGSNISTSSDYEINLVTKF